MQDHGELLARARSAPAGAGTSPLGSAPRRLLLARLQYARALTGARARELADRALADYFRDADPAIADAYDAVGRAGW